MEIYSKEETEKIVFLGRRKTNIIIESALELEMGESLCFLEGEWQSVSGNAEVRASIANAGIRQNPKMKFSVRTEKKYGKQIAYYVIRVQ